MKMLISCLDVLKDPFKFLSLKIVLQLFFNKTSPHMMLPPPCFKLEAGVSTSLVYIDQTLTDLCALLKTDLDVAFRLTES